MRIVVCVFLLLYGMLAEAAIYEQQNANGNVSYSDIPTTGAAELAPSESNVTRSTLPAPLTNKPEATTNTPAPTQDASSNATAKEKQPYTSFLIDSPKEGETIQNAPTFTVKLKVEPGLNEGDSVQLVLDEKLFGVPSQSTSLDLVNIPRGTHQLYAVLLDEKNTVLKRSNVITFYVQRVSLQNKPKANVLKLQAKQLVPLAKQ